MKNKIQEIILIITYGLIVYLAVWFYNTSESTSAKSTLIYTVILFAIVLIMYIYAFTGFFRINRMTSALKKFSKKITKDFHDNDGNERTWEFMWNKYKAQETWFSEKTLDRQLGKFLSKVKINEQTVKGAFSEDIEEYIGYDLIDDVIHKDVISAFPGIMTGLGILFTFFGLSICLQSFSTASSEEIMAGIDPLMSGLKVAFHTSIYGLIFSMIFNFCYRKKIEDGYKAIRDFLDEYKRCIHPENDNDGMNKLVAYEATQLALLKSMANTLTTDMAEAFYKIMTPQFEQLNGIINNFATVASKTQTDGIQRMVGAFLIEMNNAVGHAFGDVRDSIMRTCETQERYNAQMQSCIMEMSQFIENARNVSMGMDISVSKMESYFAGMSDLHRDLQDGFTNYTGQITYNNNILAQQQENLMRLTEIQKNINETFKKVQESSNEMQASVANLKEKIQGLESEIENNNQSSQDSMAALAENGRNNQDGIAALAESIETLTQAMSYKSSDNILDDLQDININNVWEDENV